MEEETDVFSGLGFISASADGLHREDTVVK